MKFSFPLQISFRTRQFGILIAFTGLLLSCTGNQTTSAAIANQAQNIPAASGDSVYYGKNSLKYTIAGRHVDIKDALKMGEGKYTTVLFVNRAKKDAATGLVAVQVTNLITGEVFNLSFSSSGTTKVLRYSPANPGSEKNGLASYLGAHSVVSYYGESVTIEVTSLDATHVAGTFSGKFVASDPVPASVQITDGSFDVLFKAD